MLILSKKPEIQCPVCDSTIPEGADECPKCELDREIIEMGGESDDSMEALDEQLDELEQVGEDLDIEEGGSNKIEDGPDKGSWELDGFEDEIEERDSVDESVTDLEKDLEREKDEDSLDDSIAGLEEELELEEDEGSLDDSIADLEEELELGEKAESGEKIYECPECKEKIAEDTEECPHCGVVFGKEKEETEEKREREEDIQKRFDSSMEKANSKLSVFDDEPVPKEHFESLIEEAKSLGDASRYKDGIDKIEEALEFGEELEEISARLEKLDEKVKMLRKKGFDYEDFEKKAKEAKESIRKGKANEALSVIDETLRDIEKRKEEERGDIKKRINKTVRDLNEILGVAKKIDVPLGDIRKIISKSLELSRKGRVDRALEALEQARDESSRILKEKIDDTLSELEGKRDSIFGDEKKNELDRYLEEANKAKEQDRFGEAYKCITECKKITEKSELKIGDMSVNEIIKIKELSEDIELDCGDAEELIAEAKREHKKGNTRRSKNSLKKARENLLKRVPREIQRVMREGMKELEEAKKRDEDISKPISYLKQSNLMIKKKNLVDALEYVNKFTDSLEQISEEAEGTSATVSRVEQKTGPYTEEKRTAKTSKEARDKALSRSGQRERDRTKSEPSTSVAKTEDRAVEFDIDEFYGGSTNLLKVKDLSNAYELFEGLLKKRKDGVCVTRDYPEKAKKKYGLQEFIETGGTDGPSGPSDEIDVSIIWLSNVGREEAVKPKDLEKLSFKLESFITRGVGVILLNGFEFLVSNNDFKTVLHLIQSLKDQVAMGGSILLITASPDSFDKSQMDQLEREVDEVFQ